METLYERLVTISREAEAWGFITSMWGEGTEFEAISRVEFDEETGMWSGYLIFKDTRFSPEEAEFPGIQFKYGTASAGNGVLANQRAEETWKTLTGVFEGLMKGGSGAS